MGIVEKPKGEAFDNGKAGADGQFEQYAVLPTPERKQWVRKFRDSYEHVGERPAHPTRELTVEEHEQYDRFGYVAYEPYPEGSGSVSGRFWTAEQLKAGCGAVTKMGRELAETYAADPTYYGSTFCIRCRTHRPVAEFVWCVDRMRVGS